MMTRATSVSSCHGDALKRSHYLTLLWFLFALSNCQADENSSSTAATTSKRLPGLLNINGTDIPTPVCRLRAVDPYMHQKISDLVLVDKVNLLEYKLVFANSTWNPLLVNLTTSYRLDTWARVSSVHGQMLLSLAFNYGILSLTTLTFGTERMSIEVTDEPTNCCRALTETEKIDAVLALLMRDFKDDQTQPVTFVREERVCHETIRVVGGRAKFEDRCFYKNRLTGAIESTTDNRSDWLTFLYVLLTFVRLIVFFFGPLLLAKSIGNMSPPHVPYIVKPKESLTKTVYLHRATKKGGGSVVASLPHCRQCIDLRKVRGFLKLKESLASAPVGEVFEAAINEYHIDVAYRRLMVENRAPVRFWYIICRSIFLCKLKNVGPFIDCCKTNLLRSLCSKCRIEWVSMWKKVGLALLVLFIPTPYYLRLAIYYYYERAEVLSRKAAADRLQIKQSFEGNLMHYLTPEHVFFYFIYIVYFTAAFIVAYISRGSEEGRLRKVISGSFNDLRKLPWFAGVLRMIVSNIIWPFRRYGIVGCLVGLIYWPIVMPLTLIVALFYSLPTLYLTVRMCFYSKRAFLSRVTALPAFQSYRANQPVDDSIRMFDVATIFPSFRIFRILGCADKEDPTDVVERQQHLTATHNTTKDSEVNGGVTQPPVHQRQPVRPRGLLEHIAAAVMCLLALYSCLVVLSECVACVVEMCVFTLMGVIVNAGILLEYPTLIILVVIYTYDSFNNVEKKYLKLSKALFKEIRTRIKDLAAVTSQPSHIQENYAFKAQELSQQAHYEVPDDLMLRSKRRHWLINDLVLFVDNQDMPRIPRQLFDDVCQIRVAGVPGPIYRGILSALWQFVKIAVFIFFVFVVVLSFGEVYHVSATNQMLAALAGGFLPLILSRFMAPAAPDIEIGTVKFCAKLDEVINNFRQYWPLYDLPLTVCRMPPLAEPERDDVDSAAVEQDQGDDGTDPRRGDAKRKPNYLVLYTTKKTDKVNDIKSNDDDELKKVSVEPVTKALEADSSKKSVPPVDWLIILSEELTDTAKQQYPIKSCVKRPLIGVKNV